MTKSYSRVNLHIVLLILWKNCIHISAKRQNYDNKNSHTAVITNIYLHCQCYLDKNKQYCSQYDLIQNVFWSYNLALWYESEGNRLHVSGCSNDKHTIKAVSTCTCYLQFCLSVRNSVPLSNKVQYLKFGWWYSNQTWTVSSSTVLVPHTSLTSYAPGVRRAGSKCRT